MQSALRFLLWFGGRRARHALCFALTLVAFAAAATAQTPPPSSPLSPEEITAYLNRSIESYRQIVSQQQIATEPSDMLFLNDARASSLQALRQAFEFARAAAALGSTAGNTDSQLDPNGDAGRAQRLAQAEAAAVARVQQLQSQIEGLSARIEKASPKQRPGLISQRAELAAELNLQTALRDNLQNLGTFLGGAGAGGGLSGQIAELERSVPEVRAENTHVASPTQQTTAAPERIGSAGIFKLSSELFALTRKIHTIHDVTSQITALRDEAQGIRAPIVAELRKTLQTGDQATSPGQQPDPKALNDMAVRFRELSAVALPLRKQVVLLDATRGELSQWRGATEREYSLVSRGLLLRLLILAISISVLLVLSHFWRRAIFRYVADGRRRSQFLLLRRIVVAFAVALIITFGLATELGSLATFAGFLTAGLALALQNVILAVVAYFFLIGRHGLRVGDRVTLSGVTGDVVEMGIVRIYLMELTGVASDYRPTGRIVVFSNAVLFQPNGNLYKQMPGTTYIWHEIALTLAPDSDYQLAERRFMQAVDEVYSEYRGELEQQYAAVERSINVAVAPPKPEGHLRLVESGLEFLLRYPVEIRRAAEIDDRVTRRLLEALSEEPKLRMVASGTPRIQPGVVTPATGRI